MFLSIIVLLAGCESGNKEIYQFEGISMSPTITDQQKVVVNYDYYINKEIQRDDIILLNLEDTQHIKRVIGLPDELIQILDGTIYINSEPIDSEYDFVDVWADNILEDGIQLKSDEYFVIGDNLKPMTSKDSRSVGPIAKKDILGKVVEIK